MIRSILTGAVLALAFVAPAAQAAETTVDGRAVYNFRCYFCHGYSGNAKTLAATYLNPKPSDFTQADPARVTRELVLATLRHGRPGTAMKSFAGVISEQEMAAVADFVVDEFVTSKAPNTRYHTVENGWPEHERYRAAFPFATGEIPLSRPWESLSPEQAAGKRLYLGACVSCHDRGAPGDDGVAWDSRPLSFPRNNFSLVESMAKPPTKVDAITSASPYLLHDIPLKVRGLTAQERRGERLFQQNCAFCHGADGTGMNWIGQFMEPHPRNLQDPIFMGSATRESLRRAIREGLPNTSMPAWKSVLREHDIQAIIAYINKALHPIGQPRPAN
ncbi:MAG: c-type cytochrome [Rhodocyclales bacterium]|nr:c-type cytochrome [Rhodocyclales bacterium]